MKCRICDSKMTVKASDYCGYQLMEEYLTCDVCHGQSYGFEYGSTREVLAYPDGCNMVEVTGHYTDTPEIIQAREEAIQKFADYLRLCRAIKNEDSK